MLPHALSMNIFRRDGAMDRTVNERVDRFAVFTLNWTSLKNSCSLQAVSEQTFCKSNIVPQTIIKYMCL